LETIHKQSLTNFQVALDQELLFLDSILTSPLHRQSKSPTLWYHRAWLRHYQSPGSSGRVNSISDELDIVLKSGERHAMNYYAWQYARSLFSHETPLEDQLLIEFADRVKTWCLAHPSDASAWSFLSYLLRLLSSFSASYPILRSIIDFVETTKWEKEALLMFLKDIKRQPELWIDPQGQAILFRMQKDQDK
jgi:hypothetical protein